MINALSVQTDFIQMVISVITNVLSMKMVHPKQVLMTLGLRKKKKSIIVNKKKTVGHHNDIRR